MRRDRGSATVLVVAVLGVVIALLIGALALVHAAAASTRARTAADLGALAGAGQLLSVSDSGDPCAMAASIVRQNGGEVLTCTTSGQTITVQVEVATRWPGLGQATARSRAGPAPMSAASRPRG